MAQRTNFLTLLLNFVKEALFYEKFSDNSVQCTLCPHNCIISEGKSGVCKVRFNNNGTLYSFVYGHPISSALDPIEKKPLFHFLPGSYTFSLATFGCNLKCDFCQNHTISQFPEVNQIQFRNYLKSEEVSPEKIVEKAFNSKAASISFTYTEPTIFFEYCLDIAKLAIQRGIKNVFVSNGYINEKAIVAIAPYLSAINIDLKAFRDETYKKIMRGRLQPVLTAIEKYHSLGVLVEITTLLIPGINDSPEELREIADFIGNISREIPWHTSAFRPHYKRLKNQSTTLDSIGVAKEAGNMAGLKFHYSGNFFGFEGENTYCPSCKKLLINRLGFSVISNSMKENKCGYCGYKIPGIF